MKKIGIFGIVCLILIIIFAGVMQILTWKIQTKEPEIKTQIQNALGLPIKIESLSTHWWGCSIIVTLNKVQVLDKTQSFDIIKASSIDLSTSFSRILLSQFKSNDKDNLSDKNGLFNKIVINDSQMRMGFDKQNNFILYGLKGESLSKAVNPIFINKDLDEIVLNQATVIWQTKNKQISQKQISQQLNGSLTWLDKKQQTFTFRGKQNFKIGSQPYLPTMDSIIDIDPNRGSASLKLTILGASLDCYLSFKAPYVIDCLGKGKDIDLALIHKKSLQEVGPEWLTYLANALKKGTINVNQFKITGDLEDLKWNGQVDFKGVDYQYQPNWPGITEASGKIDFNEENLKVHLSKGKLFGVNIDKTEGVIGPLNAKAAPVVSVIGALQTNLETGLAFLEETPLKKSVANPLSTLQPKGPFTLKLNLNVPLEEKLPVEVKGTLNVKNASLQMDEIPVTKIAGEIEFTENSINSKQIQGEMLNHELVGDITKGLLQAKTNMSIADIEKTLNVSLANYAKGSTEIIFTKNLKAPELTIESNLEGIEIDLPPPFYKASSQKQRFVLNWVPAKNQERKFHIEYDQLLNAAILLQTEKNATESSVKLKSAHLVFGKEQTANWKGKNKILIEGAIDHLKIGDWWSFLNQQKKTFLSLPIEIDLKAQHLEGFGLSLNDTVLQYSPEKNPLMFGLSGPKMKGSVILPSDDNPLLDLNFERLDLSALALPASGDNTVHELLAEKKPNVNFQCDNLSSDDKDFGKVSFRLVPIESGYGIKDLTASSEVYHLHATGAWNTEKPVTSLQGQVQSSNIGKALKQWGYPNPISGARGDIQFNIQWTLSPFQFDWDNVNGNTHIAITKGSILGVNTGMGKLMGLFSLSTLIRRIFLDFSDVFKKGFPFDTMTADIDFQNGIARTDNFDVNGSLAKIAIRGNIAIKSKAIDLDMKVNPKVGLEWGVPLATAVGSPAAGFGVAAFETLSGSNLTKIVINKQYHVTGTWEAPKIQERK